MIIKFGRNKLRPSRVEYDETTGGEVESGLFAVALGDERTVGERLQVEDGGGTVRVGAHQDLRGVGAFLLQNAEGGRQAFAAEREGVCRREIRLSRALLGVAAVRAAGEDEREVGGLAFVHERHVNWFSSSVRRSPLRLGPGTAFVRPAIASCWAVRLG